MVRGGLVEVLVGGGWWCGWSLGASLIQCATPEGSQPVTTFSKTIAERLRLTFFFLLKALLEPLLGDKIVSTHFASARNSALFLQALAYPSAAKANRWTSC